MIGSWRDTVVCLTVSVRLSVTLCIVALKVGVGVESCTFVFPTGHFLFTPNTCCRMYRYGEIKIVNNGFKPSHRLETSKAVGCCMCHDCCLCE